MESPHLQLEWDPEVDTPATIAVLGGGMLAVEAALYARFLGYSVMLFDSGRIGDRLSGWGERPLMDADGRASTWGAVTTPLGRAALEAQHGSKALPPLEQSVTSREYVERYLLPVARTDLLYDSIQVHSVVRSISRLGCAGAVNCSPEQRSELLFRALIDARSRGEYSQLFDLVLDCQEAGQERIGLAFGGGLAIGETLYAPGMLHGKMAVEGKYRSRLVGKHSLLFGGGWDAGAMALDLAELIESTEGTRMTWVVPKQWGSQGFSLGVNDRDWRSTEVASEVDQHRRATLQRLVERGDPRLVVLGAWGVEALSRGDMGLRSRGGGRGQEDPEAGAAAHHDHDHDQGHDHDHDQGHDHDPDGAHGTHGREREGLQGRQSVPGKAADHWTLRLQTKSEETLDISGDEFINCAQPHGRRAYAEMLNIEPLAAGDGLMTAEPHYYRLGNDYGHLPASEVRERIRRAFALIGGRRELNLYTSVKPVGEME
jgi:hypothetical protein